MGSPEIDAGALADHVEGIRRLAHHLIRDPAAADDAAQETFLLALRRRAVGVANVGAWLRGILRNKAKEARRAEARRSRHEGAASGGGPMPSTADVAAQIEAHERLIAAVRSLSGTHRNALWLHYVLDVPVPDVARRLGLPVETVRTQVRRGLAELRAELDRRSGGDRSAWIAGLLPLLEGGAAGPAIGAGAASASSKSIAVAAAVLLGLGAGAFWLVRSDGASPENATPRRPVVSPGAGEAPAPPAEELPPPATAPAPDAAVAPPPAPAVAARREVPPGPERAATSDAPAPPPSDGVPSRPEPATSPAGDEPKRPTPADPDPVLAGLPPPPAPVPPGMVYVPPGRATIGNTAERIESLGAGRDAKVRADLRFEGPQFSKDMPGYFFGAGEVTNAQYLVFLRDTMATRDTGEGAARALPGWAAEFLRTPPEVAARDDRSWRRLYRGNRRALWAAMPDLVVRRPDGTPDEAATEEAFRRAPLVPGIVLAFYARRIPDDWPGMEPDPREVARPVRWVSYFDAEAFAEWAGGHVPTEEEWEYAMRGPEGRELPWGDAWDPDRCNWGGRITYGEPEYRGTPLYLKPRTVDVFDPRFASGRSWCGAWHGIGNVAEWTSSWFRRYPATSPDRDHPYLGNYVKVLRGGTLIDQDLLALRPAARNFVGAGPSAPPVPSNPFEYVGIRLARYVEPGRDAAVPAIRRASRGLGVGEEEFDLGRVAGVTVRHDATDGAAEDGVFVVGRARSILVAPRSAVLAPGDDDRRLRTVDDLLDRSEEDAVPLAVFHSDAALDAFVEDPPADGAARRPRRERPLRRGACAPGTYLLCVLGRRLVLTSPTLEVVCHLEPDPLDRTRHVALNLSPKADVRSVLEVAGREVRLSFDVAIGGRRTKEVFEVRSAFRLAPGAWEGR